MRVISLYRSPSIYSAVMNGRAEQIALWGRGRFLFCFVFSIFDVRLVLEFHLLVRFVVSSSHHHHTYIVCVVVFSHFATTQHLVVMYSFSALCGILICVLAPLLYLMSSPTSFKSYILRRRLPFFCSWFLGCHPGRVSMPSSTVITLDSELPHRLRARFKWQTSTYARHPFFTAKRSSSVM